MLIIAAFALSLLNIAYSVWAIRNSSSWDGFVRLVLLMYPGAIGLVFALLSLVVIWIPVAKVASPYLAGISCVITLSLIGYRFVVYLLNR